MPIVKESVTRFYCDFCGKESADVEQMIVGPNERVICNECVAKCSALIHEKRLEKFQK
jgi:ATP-dependent protease Clp ATPase subunit